MNPYQHNDKVQIIQTSKLISSSIRRMNLPNTLLVFLEVTIFKATKSHVVLVDHMKRK